MTIFKITDEQLNEILRMLNNHQVLKVRSLLTNLEVLEEIKNKEIKKSG